MLYLSFTDIAHYPTIAILLFTLGLLTDIFDGIIARKLGISTQRLRRLDSSIDQIFFICVAIATYIQCPVFFQSHLTEIILLISFEALTYLICFIKFKKEVATHAISSKIWTLILFASMIQIMGTCNSGWLFQIAIYLGLLTRLEIMAIIITIKTWTNDVPSIYHAVQLRKGLPIKRHKLFNG